jgi:hypothetical protein
MAARVSPVAAQPPLLSNSWAAKTLSLFAFCECAACVVAASVLMRRSDNNCVGRERGGDFAQVSKRFDMLWFESERQN